MKTTVAALVILSLAAPALADRYDFQFAGPSSTTSTSLNADLPFALGGASFILGNWDATTNPTGTRTIPGLAGGNPALNTPIPLTGGRVTASGNAFTNPAGSLRAVVDTAALTISVSNLLSDGLADATPSYPVNVTIRYSSFRTVQPTCTIFGGFDVTIPVGSITLSQAVVTQNAGDITGPLTPTATPNQYSFSLEIPGTLSTTAAFGSQTIGSSVVAAAVLLSGTITINPVTKVATLASTGNFAAVQNIANPTPSGTPAPFTAPLCAANLVLSAVFAGGTINSSATLTLSTSAPRTCIADVTGDNEVDLADFFEFLNCFDTNQPCADVNDDSQIDLSDFFDFLNAFDASC